jgi:hypothetical protein
VLSRRLPRQALPERELSQLRRDICCECTNASEVRATIVVEVKRTEQVRRRRIWITATYHKGVTGNIPKAIEACELWIQDYPRAEMPHLYLEGGSFAGRSI